ncbi:hypothetical protein GpartN1_g3435.t1 [Galdieria partita]|uniref:Uncharacterized protein n=1 Tax=Galdieria partita TaxID=83374 RepID=A0A9C7PWT8_9RHOD|nr:hypothetical protein GpartN1_g3435.t1 [Galdieria partita]
MLVTNHAASKVKEFIARQRGLEVGEKSEHRHSIVYDPRSGSLQRNGGSGIQSRRGLGSSSKSTSASSSSFDIKLQVALSKGIQNSRRDSNSKSSIFSKEDQVTSDEESKTKYQKTRRYKKGFQEKIMKVVPRRASIRVDHKNNDSFITNELLNQDIQEVQREEGTKDVELKNPPLSGQQNEGKDIPSQLQNKPLWCKKTRQKKLHKGRKHPAYAQSEKLERSLEPT